MTKLTTPSWSEETITGQELLKFFIKAERLNYRYYVSEEKKELHDEDDDIFWIFLDTKYDGEYGGKYIKLNQSKLQHSSNYYSLKQLNDFLDDRLKERMDTVERERKLQKLLQKLTPEERELLGVS